MSDTHKPMKWKRSINAIERSFIAANFVDIQVEISPTAFHKSEGQTRPKKQPIGSIASYI